MATLGLLDIRFGTIRLPDSITDAIPTGQRTIRVEDDLGDESVGFLDPERSLLSIASWIASRGLDYGDRVELSLAPFEGTLHLCPTGERDEQAHQEAANRQDLDRLAREARSVGRSYHDLMIEIMEAVGEPLHREDIYQLVDYRRTASRSYIFSLLSLHDYPYEELRYFVPHQRYYWSFDRSRKEAFDMKMAELTHENQELRTQLESLQTRVHRQHEHLSVRDDQSRALEEQLANDLAIARQKAAEATRGNRELAERLESAQAAAISASSHVADLEIRLAHAEEMASDAEHRAQKARDRGASARSLVVSCESQLADLRNGLSDALKARIRAEERVTELEQAYADARAEIIALEQRIDAVTSEREHLEAQMQSGQDAHSRDMDSLRGELERVRAEQKATALSVESLDCERENLRTRLQTLQGSLEDATLRLGSATRTLSERTEQLRSAEVIVQELTASLTGLRVRYEQLDQSRADLSAEAKALKMGRDALGAERESLARRLSEQALALQEATEALARESSLREATEREVAQLRESVCEIWDEESKVRAAAAEGAARDRAALEESQQALDQCKAEVVALRAAQLRVQTALRRPIGCLAARLLRIELGAWR